MTQSTAHTPTFMLDYMNYDFSSFSGNQVEEISSYGDIIREMKSNIIGTIEGITDCIDSQERIQIVLNPDSLVHLQIRLDFNHETGRWSTPLEELSVEELLDLFECLRDTEC